MYASAEVVFAPFTTTNRAWPVTPSTTLKVRLEATTRFVDVITDPRADNGLETTYIMAHEDELDQYQLAQ